ncbi:MAG: von Willebrand factor type A domain-containing protein [Planctomycetota bacterium]
MKTRILDPFSKKGKHWLVSIVVHCVVLIALAYTTFYVVSSTTDKEEKAIVMRQSPTTLEYQEYSANVKRLVMVAPEIESEILCESPVINCGEEIKMTRDVPRGTSFDNLSSKNIDSTSRVDAYGVGGGRVGTYGAGGGDTGGKYGRRWGKGVPTGGNAPKQAPNPALKPAPNPVYAGNVIPDTGGQSGAMFFEHYGFNPEIQTEENNISTFGVDVDTAAYTLCRKYIEMGKLPSDEAVRIEEFINFFDYGYKAPENEPFAIYLHAAKTPFAKENRTLLRIGIKACELVKSERKDANLTFVIDTSGSMNSGNRLGLVKKALEMLVNQLRPTDTIAIAAYSTSARIIIANTPVSKKEVILRAIDELQANGSTNVCAGLQLGYRIAAENFEKGRINKVILCSDGVANQSSTYPETILKEVEQQRNKGITLFCVGVGMGNYNDVLLEKLGDKGDGHYVYIDTLDEAKRVFVENLAGTLQTVAKDMKVQVEFNADAVISYRLIGYENRALKNEDFKNDKVDSGEVGVGHSVTALYVVKLRENPEGDLSIVRLRWKNVEGETVNEKETKIGIAEVGESFDSSPASFRLATVVAQFAEVLRKSYWADEKTLKSIAEITDGLASELDDKKVAEFAKLAQIVKRLKFRAQGEQLVEIIHRYIRQE